ncbi:hypothetical protein M426DRAFT_22756 [Hypoxylon sp. CI-4A]|nr:hypothetical protein M426DRAFT_22756 [Hypoxylon sp. CI-4A]
MASKRATTSTTKSALNMKQLSPSVYFYEPETIVEQHPSDPRVPKLVLVASWMDAQDKHIANYTIRYQTIYPNSRILLIKFNPKESIFTLSPQRNVEPGVVYLRSLIDSGVLSASPTQPEILVHVFSNGGSSTMRLLYQAFQSRTGHPFPLHTAVYDSCPGLYAFKSIFSAFIVGFPQGIARLIATPFITAFIVCLWTWHNPLKIIGGEDPLLKNSKILNDLDLVKQTNRSYIYGKADVMVDWKDVEKHADQAAAKGLAVRREVFGRSPHVTHVKLDGNRYWRIVKETWEAAITKR